VALILAWVVFPLALAAIGAGWGVIVELLAGRNLGNALLIPMGLAAALVVGGTLTAFSSTASAAVPIVGVGTVVGLLLAWPRLRLGRITMPGRWPLIGRWALFAAIGVLLVYGAPVLLSGQATFTGFVKLDDTSTWLNVVDIIMGHGRSVASLPASTFSLTFTGDIGESYPLGSFVLLGLGHGLTGIDAAWTFQPYEACAGAALALCIYALATPLIPSQRIRALVAFLGAQPALLYGYAMWGGVKEVTAAFLLALGAALAADLLRRPVQGRDGAPAGTMPWLAWLRALIPIGVGAGAMIQALGIGAGGWVAPAFALLALAWFWQALRARGLDAKARSALGVVGRLVGLAAIGALCVLPVWVVLAYFLQHDAGLFSEGQSTFTKFGNLLGPLSGWQLLGIWPVGDFRDLVVPFWSWILIGVAVLAGLTGLVLGVVRRQLDVALYLAIGLLGVAAFLVVGASPWVTGKALAISSPALLTAALAGAAMLWSSRAARVPPIAGAAQASPPAAPVAPPPPRPTSEPRSGSALVRAARSAWFLGPVAIALIGFGVVWSNVLAYHEVTLAPRARLAELQHIGTLVKGKGPTFVNMYEVYADRHFLREGSPTEPAEYRQAQLPLRSGQILTKAAWADLNSFGPNTLAPYRSIVTQRTPVESRPPSIYKPVWQGRYYELWQRPETPSTKVVEQVDYGESNSHPYCGIATNGPPKPVCSLNPVAVPSCPQIKAVARKAQGMGGWLVAYQRPSPVTAYGDDVVWPGYWIHEPSSHSLLPTAYGTAVGHLEVPSSQRYELWLAGDFNRGFEVSVDGHHVGNARNELALFNDYAHVVDLYLPAGIHKIEYTYPSGTAFPEVLAPGSGWNEFTVLNAVLLQPMQSPTSELITVRPGEATRLCGHPLNWVEVVKSA
jgi:hypothetical protein